MALIYNTTDEKQKVTVFGNHFEFKPGEIKHFYQENMAQFMTVDLAHQGLVSLPETFSDLTHKDSEDGKKELAVMKARGLERYCKWLESRVRNCLVSLRRDLERAGFKHDPLTEASSGEEEAMKLLAKYRSKGADEKQLRVEELKKLQTTLSK